MYFLKSSRLEVQYQGIGGVGFILGLFPGLADGCLFMRPCPHLVFMQTFPISLFNLISLLIRIPVRWIHFNYLFKGLSLNTVIFCGTGVWGFNM